MQDHFTKWAEGHVICSKEPFPVADAVVQDWIVKHGADISLHSDRGHEFTMENYQGVCDLLHITKTYSTAYRPQANAMVERCNRTLLAMLQAVVSECQIIGMTIFPRYLVHITLHLTVVWEEAPSVCCMGWR